ncbi:hypothetical protein B0H13DRAFT_1884781 [Mycena leptocephala]|nr:hypothetical protein B0H13DRAFT_1884781 [Mycena leptocephala]
MSPPNTNPSCTMNKIRKMQNDAVRDKGRTSGTKTFQRGDDFGSWEYTKKYGNKHEMAGRRPQVNQLDVWVRRRTYCVEKYGYMRAGVDLSNERAGKIEKTANKTGKQETQAKPTQKLKSTRRRFLRKTQFGTEKRKENPEHSRNQHSPAGWASPGKILRGACLCRGVSPPCWPFPGVPHPPVALFGVESRKCVDESGHDTPK